MNVAVLMQAMNVGTPAIQRANNEAPPVSSFKDVLALEQNSSQMDNSGQISVGIVEEEVTVDPMKLLTEDIEAILAALPMEDGIFKQPISEEDLLQLNFLPEPQLQEVENIVKGSYSLDEIIEKMNDASPLAGILSLLIGMEKLSEQTDVNFKEPLLKIKQMFEETVPTLSNNKTSENITITNFIKDLQALDEADFTKLASHLTAVKLAAMYEQKRENILPLLKNIDDLPDHVSQFLNKTAGTALEKEVVQEIVTHIKTELKSGQPIQNIQTIIESVITKFQTVEPRSEVKTEITISLDQFVNKDQALTVIKEKVEPQVRQEFTNQLLTAMKNSRFGQTPNGTNRLIIKLNPEHLGQLTIRLTQQNGEMVARIIASTQSAKDLLEHSVNQLRHVLPSVSVQIDRFELLAENYREQQGNKERNEQSDAQSGQKQKDDETDASQSFKEVFTTQIGSEEVESE
ncbi:flagellar hook-length control protein FliK [Metabacillus fastidiosus]|uniref:flagellar hook-length control protein FliK n=1 Tax=Metabacillus fastidiosus TaxID=1458 RepID=UPI0008250A59|nr:flagellar hook-length control protein FliK [Metabacillus fastidiosus]MED4463162.1 flagellar hook-length control protein FliK [Metabacillus fastidiosus]